MDKLFAHLNIVSFIKKIIITSPLKFDCRLLTIPTYTHNIVCDPRFCHLRFYNFSTYFSDNVAPYGIFARSCVAMAKDSKSTFQIIDDEGCPVDPTIFPGFSPEGNALQSVYEAFRFTESYGVIFQCNVKYCLGPCEPVMIPLSATIAVIINNDQ